MSRALKTIRKKLAIISHCNTLFASFCIVFDIQSNKINLYKLCIFQAGGYYLFYYVLTIESPANQLKSILLLYGYRLGFWDYVWLVVRLVKGNEALPV